MDEELYYLVDTNSLLKNPKILEEYKIVITSHVLREIEQLERRKNDRILQYEIRNLKRALDTYDHLYYDIKDYKFTLNDIYDPQYTDNILLQICLDNNYGMITNDRLLKEKCKLHNIKFTDINSNTFIEYKGFKEIFVTQEQLNKIHLNLGINQFGLITNEYISIYDELNGDLLDILKWNGEHLISLRDNKGKLGRGFKTFQFGEFTPMDAQQIMAVDSILNNQLTSIRGRAGSGKSLISLNTAWYLVEKKGYKLVIFCNPVPSLNAQELGFYKGNRIEKLLQTVGTMLKSKFGDEVEILRQIQDGKLDILPFADIRGYDTSGQKTICWFVESQNLTSELMKLGLQRLGEDTKAIIDGDFHLQTDKDIYATDNGMKRMSEVFRGTELYGEIELQIVHRSRLADIAEQM